MARLRALLHRRATERGLDEEIRFHTELETERNVRQGFTPEEARGRSCASRRGG